MAPGDGAGRTWRVIADGDAEAAAAVAAMADGILEAYGGGGDLDAFLADRLPALCDVAARAAVTGSGPAAASRRREVVRLVPRVAEEVRRRLLVPGRAGSAS